MVGEIYYKELQVFPKWMQGSSSKGSCRKCIEKRNHNKMKQKKKTNPKLLEKLETISRK